MRATKIFDEILNRHKYIMPDRPNVKLYSTTRVIGALYPFNNLVSPVAGFWLAKLKKKELQYGDKTQNIEIEGIGESITGNSKIDRLDNMIKCTNDLKTFFQEASLSITSDGNIAEDIVCKKLMGEEVITETVNSKRAIEFGELLYQAVKSLETKIGKLKVVEFQVPLFDDSNNTLGVIDAIFETEDKELVLVDFKTGNKLEKDKLEAVKLQLLGSYYNKVFLEYGKKPKYVYAISAFEKELEVDGIKQFVRGFENKDLLGMTPTKELQSAQQRFEDALIVYKIKLKYNVLVFDENNLSDNML